MTYYVVETRYPGLAEPVSREEYAEAIDLAEEVVRWWKKDYGVGDKFVAFQWDTMYHKRGRRNLRWRKYLKKNFKHMRLKKVS